MSAGLADIVADRLITLARTTEGRAYLLQYLADDGPARPAGRAGDGL
jgi:hypothetical protein